MGGRLTETEWIWKDGEFLRWEEATLHVMSHVVQFGSSIFEGIRCYQTPDGPAIFRLDDHVRRFFDSCRVYRMEPELDPDGLAEACVASIRRNELTEGYLRPMAIRGYGSAGLDPSESPVEVYVVSWPWGEYLGKGALESGVDVCVSSWQRAHPDTYPVGAKAAGNYLNAQLIKMEAMENGYTEGIALAPSGLVSEGSGQNLFLVRDGVLRTPAVDGTLLAGITRATVLELAGEMGIPVREQGIPREMLYASDELFFVGTATEVTPIRSVDGITVGNGKMGPMTRRIQARYLETARGEVPDSRGWLTPVGEGM